MPEIPYKITTTVAINGGFVVMGVGTGIVGPTIITLAENINQNISALSFLVFLKGFGYISGSFLTQFLSKKISQYNLLAIALAMTACGEAICPLLPSAALIIFSKFLSGFGMGVLENSGMVTIVQIWKEKSDPILQLGQLCYGLGSVISPFLAKPFINPILRDLPYNETELGVNSTTSIITTSVLSENISPIPSVAWPYFIIAGLSGIMAITFIFLGRLSPALYAPKKPEKLQRDEPIFRNPQH